MRSLFSKRGSLLVLRATLLSVAAAIATAGVALGDGGGGIWPMRIWSF